MCIFIYEGLRRLRTDTHMACSLTNAAHTHRHSAQSNCKKPWSWSHERNRHSHTHTQRHLHVNLATAVNNDYVDSGVDATSTLIAIAMGMGLSVVVVVVVAIIYCTWFDLIYSQDKFLLLLFFCFPNLVFACFVFGCDASDSAEGDSSSNGTSHLHL